MRRLFTLLSSLLLLTSASAVIASEVPRYRMRTPLQKVTGDEVSAMGSRRFGHWQAVGAAAVTPGVLIGTTYYDYQHNGSTGRQVDKTGNYVQASWTKGTTPSLSLRTVNWNRVAVNGSPADFTLDNGQTVRRVPLSNPLLSEGQAFSAVRPGYTNFRNRPGGKAVCQYHDFPESGGIQYWEAQLDLTAGNGIFAGAPSTSPNPPGSEYQATAVVWPKQAITQCGGDMVHIATGTWSGASNEVWYWRGIINDGAGTITWPGLQPTLLDPLNPNDVFITNVIEANGQEVQIFMFKAINNTNADLVRYVSTDCGQSWGAMQNITNYSATDPEGGNVDIDIAYDGSGDIHAIFDTAPATGETTPTNLYHWSSATGVRLITSAGWTNSCGGGTITDIAPNNGAGTNNLAIAEVSLSIKPAGVHGITEELLYAIWTQYGPTDTDCATVDDQGTLGGHVNGELYCSVSSNGGVTWDRPQNITGTVTPDCAPGDCASESWVTSAARADSGVYLSYVDDAHAGPIVFAGGAWVDSPYRLYAPGARQPVLAPVIAVTPTNYIELNASPAGGSQSVNLNVISVGNADLNYTVTVMADNGGASHVTVNGLPSVSSTILAGGAPHVINVGYDAVGLGNPAEYHWRLEVTSNDPVNDPGQGGEAIDVNLQVFSSTVWHVCTDDTLSTGTHRMQVSSCLEMGDVGATGAGFVSYADSSEWMYSGSPVVTRVTGSGDTVAYHNAFMSLADRTRALNKSYRAQSALHVKRDSSITVGDSTYTADVATGTSSSTDTTIELEYAMVFPKTVASGKGAYFRLAMSSLTGAPLGGTSFGVVADIDLDPGAGENAGVGSAANGWIGGVGGTADTAGNFTPNTNYMALFHVPLGAQCDEDGAVAAQVLANPNYVHPESAYNTDSLYRLFTTFGGAASWGTGIHIDTGQSFDDISVMLVSGYNQTVSHLTPTVWAYGLAVSSVSTGDLEQTMAAVRAAASAACQVTCLITLNGDMNGSNTVTSADIITLVNFVFKGGPAPQPCPAAGDVNCSNTVTSADIITLVNFVFKGGAPPCDICAGSTLPCS